jgi:uncharacterized protein YecE (DUF72 family)
MARNRAIWAMASAGQVRVGIGGWTYEPWRANFYPPGLPHARELAYAAGQVTAIEINGTYYRLQSRDSFSRWASETPDDFIFTVKASRHCTNRRILAEAGESIARFIGQGLAALGAKLGPILWQFMATKQFDRGDFSAFLALLPDRVEGIVLRHALEVRHKSFVTPEFVALAREAGAAIVFADSPDYPAIADATADFVYARLQDAQAEEPAGYAPAALDRWAGVAGEWVSGGKPAGLHYVTETAPEASSRDAYVFFINGAKERAPAAAQALIARLGRA